MSVLFGTIAGIVTGLGMGGGTILILLLSLFMNLEQHIAQATNLVFFIPTALSAIIINIRHKNIDKHVTFYVSCFGIIGSVLGAVISKCLSSEKLKKYFAIFILTIAIHEIYVLYKEYNRNKKRHNKSKII